MALKHIYGNGEEGIQAIAIASGSTTPVTFGPFNIESFDSIGVQLVGIVAGREIPVTVSLNDHVVASTKTWTLAQGGFVGGNVGDHLVVTGSVSNDGTYTIATVTNSRVIITSESPNADETFGPNVRFWITDHTVSSLAGTWSVQVSNDFTPPASGLDYTEASNIPGTWTDITSSFTPTIVALTSGPGINPASQYAQANPLTTRAVRFGFLPSAGGGTAKVILVAKSWS